jgi:hypothetical protein
MSVLDTMARAKAAGVVVRLDGGQLVAEADELPSAIIIELKAVRPGLMRLLRARQAAEAALRAECPEDCWMHRWSEARRGLAGFIHDGWGDRAALLGWSPTELFNLPPLWSHIHLTGCAWLVGDKKVLVATADHIVIEASQGSRLKFRRLGRGHIA